MERFNLFLSDEQMYNLRLLAGDSGISIAEIIRRVITTSWNSNNLDKVVPEISGWLSDNHHKTR